MIQDFHGKLRNVTKSILLFLQLLHVTAEEAINPGAVFSLITMWRRRICHSARRKVSYAASGLLKNLTKSYWTC